MDLDGQLTSLPPARAYCLVLSEPRSADECAGIGESWKRALLSAGFEEPLPALLILAPGMKLQELSAADEAVVDQVVAASIGRIQKLATGGLVEGHVPRLVGE